MTLIFQNVAAAVNAAKGGKTSETGKSQGTGGAFGQALVQQMTGTPAPATPNPETALLMLNASAEMLKEIAALSGEGETSKTPSMAAGGLPKSEEDALDLIQMLLALLKRLEKLEEALEKDPSLLKELQAWLLQASGLLTKIPVESTPSADQDSLPINFAPQADQTLSPLASQPETVRFALQDAMMQLGNMVKSTELSGQTKQELANLVQSFHSLMEAAGNETKGQTELKAHSPGIQSAEVKAESTLAPGKNQIEISAKPSPVLNDSTEAAAKLAGIDGNGEPLQEEAGLGKGSPLSETGPVTAGQLALRAGLNAPVKTAPPIPVEQFAKDMTQFVVNKLEIVKHQGFTEARISLNPEHLGQVDIKISMQNGQLVAQFLTRNSDAKELLDQQMSQLRAALQGQGLQVEKLEVSQSSQSPTSQFYQEGRQPGSGQQQSNKRSKDKDMQTDDAVTAASLTDEWNEWLAERAEIENEDHGGTFTAKA